MSGSNEQSTSFLGEKADVVALKPQLGLLSGVSIIVGGIIGSGIFVSPTGVVIYAGSPGLSLIVWFSTGLVCTIGALCYAELGTMIPKSGADYAYIRHCWGDLPAFMFLWISLVVVYPMSNAIGALTFSKYFLRPILNGMGCSDDALPELAVQLLAAAIMCIMVAVAKPAAAGDDVGLRRELGLLNGVGIIVGIIIGAGIFVSPTGVVRNSGSAGMSIIVWAACGLMSLVGAMCYAELGTMIPKSGGDYAYISQIYGPLMGFLYLWVSLLIMQPVHNAIQSITFANYILAPIFDGCDSPDAATRLLAAAVLCLLTFINCYNVKWAMFVQDSLMFAKVLALCLVIVIGGYELLYLKNTENLTTRLWENTVYDPSSICLAFYSGLFSYAGWNYLNFVTEELKDPFRNLPYAIYISLPIVTVVYLLANVAYFVVLTTTEIGSASAVAVAFGERTLGSFSWIIPVAVALSTFGGLNGGIFASSRLFFVGARQGHLPDFISMINVDCCTPTPSLIFLCLLSLLYLSNTDVFVLINYTAFSEALFIMLSVGGLLWLRYAEPDLQRPIKVNIFLPIVFFLISIFLVVLPFFSQPLETLIGLGIALSGIPVYFVTVNWKNKPTGYRNAISSTTALIQKLLNSVPEKND